LISPCKHEAKGAGSPVSETANAGRERWFGKPAGLLHRHYATRRLVRQTGRFAPPALRDAQVGPANRQVCSTHITRRAGWSGKPAGLLHRHYAARRLVRQTGRFAPPALRGAQVGPANRQVCSTDIMRRVGWFGKPAGLLHRHYAARRLVRQTGRFAPPTLRGAQVGSANRQVCSTDITRRAGWSGKPAGLLHPHYAACRLVRQTGRFAPPALRGVQVGPANRQVCSTDITRRVGGAGGTVLGGRWAVSETQSSAGVSELRGVATARRFAGRRGHRSAISLPRSAQGDKFGSGLDRGNWRYFRPGRHSG